MDIGQGARLDSWTPPFRHANGISLATGSVQHAPGGARPLDESESASVADGASSAAVSESRDDEEGLVMQATEWSQVVAAARGIRGNRTPRRTFSSPSPLRRTLSLQYGGRSSDFQTKSPTYDHHYHKEARMQKEVVMKGYSDNLIGGVQLDELNMDVNLHLVTSGGQGGVDGIGFDYEPVGATSVHDTVVTDTATMEALRERIEELERTWDADIAGAARARHEELANDNARLTRRIHELEAELEYSRNASDEEVATLHRRLRDLRKSHGENMAAAADEFASLNERLKAKDAELKAKGDEAVRLKQEAKKLRHQHRQQQPPQPASHQVEASSTPQMTSSATMTSPSPIMTSSSTMTSSPTLASSFTMTSPSTVPLPLSETPSLGVPASSSTSTCAAKPSRSLFRYRARDFSLRGASRTFSLPVVDRDEGIAAKLRDQIEGEEEEEDPQHVEKGMRCEFLGISADASTARGDDSAGGNNPTEDSKKDSKNRLGRMARGYFRMSRNTGSRKDKRFSKLKPVNRSPSPSKRGNPESDVKSSPILAVEYSTLSDAPTATLSSSSSMSSTPASESSPNGSGRSSSVTALMPTGVAAGVAELAHADEVGSRSVPMSQEPENTAAAMSEAEEADGCVSDREHTASSALRAATGAETEAQEKCRELLSLLQAAQARMAEAEAKAETAVRSAAAAESQAKEREMAAITAESAAAEAVKEARAKEAKSSELMESALAKAQRAEQELAKARSAAAATHESMMYTCSPVRHLHMASPRKAQYDYRPSPRPVTIVNAGTEPGTGFGPSADIPKIPKGLVSERASAYMALATASAMSTAATARLRTKIKVIEERST